MLKFKGFKRFLLRKNACLVKEEKGGYVYYFDNRNNIYAYETASGNLMGFYISKKGIKPNEEEKIYVVGIVRASKDRIYMAITEKSKKCNSFKDDLANEKIVKEFDYGIKKWEKNNNDNKISTLGVIADNKILLDNKKEKIIIELMEEEWKKLLKENEETNLVKLNPKRIRKILNK